MNFSSLKNFATSRAGLLTGAAAASAAATAIWVEVQARRAEREHPPTGRLVDVDGVRLHYVERGEGPPIVLIHGNTVSLADFEASGLIERLAGGHRVIAFDRPGFGHSERPRDRLWTPSAQGRLFHMALAQLGAERPVVVGHSMGTLVALAMALDQPADVRSIVLLGGYFYATVRVDALLTAPSALPVVGDVMCHTVTAMAGRALLKSMVKTMFAPNEVPPAFFSVLSREMMLRPLALRSSAEDAAFMIPEAMSDSDRYGELRMPVTIVAGEKDGVVDTHDHAVRLHAELPHSELIVVPGIGHMMHYSALERVARAIEDAA